MTRSRALVFVLSVICLGGCSHGQRKLPAPAASGRFRIAPKPGAVAVTRYRVDPANSGVNSRETALTPRTVNSSGFGKVFETPLDGHVYAEPLLLPGVNVAAGRQSGVHDVLYVATENDTLYALDAKTGTVLWSDSFLKGLPEAAVTAVPAGDVDPSAVKRIGPVIGITATPAIDPVKGIIYLIAETKENVRGLSHYVWRLHAVNAADGSVTGSALIADTSFDGSGDTFGPGRFAYHAGPSVAGVGEGGGEGTLPFNAARQQFRPALVLANGRIYAASASNDDAPPYHGWILSFDASTLRLKDVFNTTPNGSAGGIWQSGGPLAVDASGNLYCVTGNGTFDVQLDASGFPVSRNYGNSVLKLSPDLKLLDYFTPSDEALLNENDVDFGSGQVVLLPDSEGSPAHPHLLVVGGKNGTLYLLDRDDLGKFNPAADRVVQKIAKATGGLWSGPALFNHTLFISGVDDQAKTFAMVPNGARISPETPASRSAAYFGYPGNMTPTISANGAEAAIVWGLTGKHSPDTLRAYDASLGFSRPLWASNQIPERDRISEGIKFSVPTVANGMVYVGAKYSVLGYGLLPAAAPALPGAPEN